MKQFYQHRVARNAIAMALIPLVNYGASFVVLIILTRVLGVETYGVVAFSIGIVQVLSILLDLGFTLSATQKISILRDRKAIVSRLTGAVLLAKLAAFVLGAGALVAYALLSEKYAGYSMLFLLTLLPLLGHTLQPLWFFLGIERMRYLTVSVVIAKLTFVAIVWFMVSSESNYLWVPLADGIAQLTAAATALVLIYHVGYRISLPRFREVKYVIRMTSGFFVSRVSATAYSYSGVVLLGLVAAPSSVALYAVAEQLYRAMHALFSPVVQSLYPYMAREKNFKLLLQIGLVCSGIAFVGALAGHFLAPHIIPAVFGTKWHGALPILDVFLVAITIHVVAMMSGYPLAAALNRTDVANSSVTYGAALYIALAFILLLTKSATPISLAWLLVFSESYVVLHCGSVLWPAAMRQHIQRISGQHLQ